MKLKILLFFIPYLLLFIPVQTQAQVVEDNTLSTKVKTQNSRDFTVNGGEERGSNLFHSFQEFSIPSNGSVLFDNAVTIQNIISRVTGSSISDINGAIKSNGNTNLFLINPNGIIFGENASLNIGGSFVGTTAESLVFEDGTEFSTNLDNSEPLLTVNMPFGLQFGSDPGEIINQANLQTLNPLDPTTPGKTLALLGSGISFDGGGADSTGNIELGSVGENSLVTLEPITTGWRANYDNVSQFQDVVLDNLALIDASGEGAGDINVWGRNIHLLNGSAIISDTGDLNGGTIQIQASDLVEIKGSDSSGTKLDSPLARIELFFPFASQISSDTLGAGKGGDIKIVAENLQLIDGGQIELQTFIEATGSAGNLNILVEDSISLNGNRPLLRKGENADNIIDSSLNLDTAIEVNQASGIYNISIGSGHGGDINITTKSLNLEDGSAIAVTPFATGDAGDIKIEASESIKILGTSSKSGSASSLIAANTFNKGDSGDINIKTNSLSLEMGGQITSATNSNVSNAGNINIDSSKVKIAGIDPTSKIDSLISTESNNGGDGGNIFLHADDLIISDRARLSVQGTGSSIPGNLVVYAKSVELDSFSRITAATESESGGNVKLNIEDNLTLREGSLISAKAVNAANGGNVNINANFIIAFPQQNNDILASAVSGDGGNININAQGVFGIEDRSSKPENLTNDIDASSEFGSAGKVELAFPLFTIIDRLFNLPSDFINVNYLFNNSFCKISGNSKFIATGRGGIPLAPDQDLLAEQTWSDWRIVDQVDPLEQGEEVENVKKIEEVKNKNLVMIQGWVTDAQGNVVLTDQPLAVAPRKPELNTPSCNEAKPSPL